MTTATDGKTIVLITGANGGIGFEVAAQLMRDAAKHVLLGSRSLEKGQAAVSSLQARGLPGSVELLHLDVANPESIFAAAQTVEEKHGRLEILINNAAIGSSSHLSLAEQMDQSFRTNATGPLLMVEAFIPLIRKALLASSRSTTARIINVSSGAGSIARRLDASHGSGAHKLGMRQIGYCASKAALNYITAAQAVHYAGAGAGGAEGMIKVFAYTPGFTVSNLGPQNTAEQGAHPTAEGAAPIVRIVDGERDEEHGGFLAMEGQYPW